ncbi:hypothetical protein PGTUg99_025407 [Puccinia graminis f. sp. tritici]|uniref:RanBP2-type domain-containing protein n=1 Tax=Puccinia graminis f. sp. tritici TaxID=56615 RepID=A0A5B0LT54_PUCGR|nr:hypothetical protein PGTUg99_025407 [Puccinia graminis f. sp. tritici]
MQLHTGRSALICAVLVSAMTMCSSPPAGMPARLPRPLRRGNSNRICANCGPEGYEVIDGQRCLYELPSPARRPCKEVLEPIRGEPPCPGIITGKEWRCDKCNCKFFESAQGCLTCESGKAKRYFPRSYVPPE